MAIFTVGGISIHWVYHQRVITWEIVPGELNRLVLNFMWVNDHQPNISNAGRLFNEMGRGSKHIITIFGGISYFRIQILGYFHIITIFWDISMIPSYFILYHQDTKGLLTPEITQIFPDGNSIDIPLLSHSYSVTILLIRHSYDRDFGV